MSHRMQQQPMDKEIAERVRELHHEHSNLGHEGILRLLEDEGIVVDEHELRLFMDEHHLDGGPTSGWSNSKDPLRAVRGDTGKR
jgi:hypothetical protein